MGTANIYSADYFMDHDVILVFLQYRLGPFGMIKNCGLIISKVLLAGFRQTTFYFILKGM